MGNALKKLRLDRGWTHDAAATAMGVSRGQFIKLERGERRLTADYIQQAARAFGVPPGQLVDPQADVPVVGYVGAGGEAIYSMGEGPFDEVPRPPGFPPNGVALIVRGNSMPGVADDGWTVYYDDRREPVTDDLFGRLCVLGLADGRVLIKKLYRGSAPGFYNLFSTAEPPIEDVTLEWAARVSWIMPG